VIKDFVDLLCQLSRWCDNDSGDLTFAVWRVSPAKPFQYGQDEREGFA
jgi:hypothetical protein